MKVVFRVDSSLLMGSGHVMRCLTLADVAVAAGAKCWFVCREYPGNLTAYIEQRGYSVYVLPNPQAPMENGLGIEAETNSHAQWLGTSQQHDADECIKILRELKPDWLVVDHYALDIQWESDVAPYAESILAIDDLADRRHMCDCLLDQTYGRRKEDYASLVPEDCKLLLGPQYALLRPQFLSWRQQSISRRAAPSMKRMLITLGGVDIDNVTGHVLNVIDGSSLSYDCEIVVIMGAKAPHLGSIKEQAANMRWPVDVRVDVANMAEVMAASDVCIGAAGTTTWERCCLGLSSLSLLIAENQKKIHDELSSIGAIYPFTKDLLDKLSEQNEQGALLRRSSLVASSLVDGDGCRRVASYLRGVPLDDKLLLVPATKNDCEYVYKLQVEPGVRKYFLNNTLPEYAGHCTWFDHTLESKERLLFRMQEHGDSVGILRLDNIHQETVEISIIVDPDHSGMGLATKAISVALELLSGLRIKAIIHQDNVASRKAFSKAGFHLALEGTPFLEYVFNG